MNQQAQQIQPPKTRRKFSDLQPKVIRNRHPEGSFQSQETLRPKLKSLKINRNKLPADFFPRTESLRKRPLEKRVSLENNMMGEVQSSRKACSERDSYSPEKTTFFGFFEEPMKIVKKGSNTLNLKRAFQSRDEQKRQKIMPEYRNLTPMTGFHRADILDMFPAIYDQAISDAFRLSKKSKPSQVGSSRKQHFYKLRQVQSIMCMQDPQKIKNKYEASKQMVNLNISTSGGSEDFHNVTFFNAKSTSLPPISKNQIL